MTYIIFENVAKYYKTNRFESKALEKTSFEIDRGEFCVLVGTRGSGKSTIINALAGKEKIKIGSVQVGNQKINKLNYFELRKYRKNKVAILNSIDNLVDELSILDNLKLVKNNDDIGIDIYEAAKKYNFSDLLKMYPKDLTRFQCQKIALIRCLISGVELILADEVIAALDYRNSVKLLKEIIDICNEYSVTFILATTDFALKKIADRVIIIKDGKVIRNEFNMNPVKIEELDF